MSKLIEMAAEIVSSHAATTAMSRNELVTELSEVYQTLLKLDKGEPVHLGEGEGLGAYPAIPKKKAFGKNKVVCLICGKEMKTLARHLRTSHQTTPKEYRKQFDIPRTQPLAARNYSERRRQMAVDRDLGENLAKARAARKRKREETVKKEEVGA